MNASFAEFVASLSVLIRSPLPGVSAQLKLAPPHRKLNPDYHNEINPPQMAAVLALLYPDMKSGSPRIVLMERSGGNHVHAMQISFPGGKREEGEEPEATAVRESYEELGIAPALVNMIGPLTRLYIPPSNFLVHPYIAYMESEPLIQMNPAEVSRVITPPVNAFLKDENIHTGMFTGTGGYKIQAPCFKVEDVVIWGATAMILSEIAELIRRIR